MNRKTYLSKENDNMKTQKCTRCGMVKPASGFRKADGTKTGLTSWCKDCHSAYVMQLYQKNTLMRKQNPEGGVPETKKCPKCRKVKPASGFRKADGTKTGLESWCKDCLNANAKQRRQKNTLMRKQNPEGGVPETQKCTKCGKVKPASGFRKAVGRKSGLTSLCKDCLSAHVRQQRQKNTLMRKQNPEWGVPETKKCTKCGKVKPASGFFKDSSSKSGLESLCKDCHSASIKQRYQKNTLMRKQNPEWGVPETKKCPKCRKVKPASGFRKADGRKTGLTSWCKDCLNAYVRHRYQKKKLMLQKFVH
jgi:hypothetical protein